MTSFRSHVAGEQQLLGDRHAALLLDEHLAVVIFLLVLSLLLLLCDIVSIR